MEGGEGESGFFSYLKFWQLTIKINRAFQAHKIRKKLASLQSMVVSVLESELSIAKKEEELVIPLRQLSNDIEELLPELTKKIIAYRRAATDLYPPRGEVLDINLKVTKISEKWGKIDSSLSKIIHYNYRGLVVNIVILVGAILPLGHMAIKFLMK